MPFGTNPASSEDALVEIIDVEIDKDTGKIVENDQGEMVPLEEPYAVFSDKTVMKFPKGTRFVPDNFEHHGHEQLRMRYQPPIDPETKALSQPSFLIPKGVSKAYVQACIKRIVDKC